MFWILQKVCFSRYEYLKPLCSYSFENKVRVLNRDVNLLYFKQIWNGHLYFFDKAKFSGHFNKNTVPFLFLIQIWPCFNVIEFLYKIDESIVNSRNSKSFNQRWTFELFWVQILIQMEILEKNKQMQIRVKIIKKK